jgi:hypothetical protein
MLTVGILIDVDDETHYRVSLHEQTAMGFAEVSQAVIGRPLQPLPGDGSDASDLCTPAHTLLHALENLEHKAAGEPGELPTWVTSALEQRGLEAPRGLGQLGQPVVMAGIEHKLRSGCR